LGGQPAKDRAIGINHMPFALVQIHFGQIRFHCKSRNKRGVKIPKKPVESTGFPWNPWICAHLRFFDAAGSMQPDIVEPLAGDLNRMRG
jgi:hypothetical protein